MAQRRGVRINWVGDDTIYIAQTIKSGPKRMDPYHIESRGKGKSKETFVRYDDDAKLLKAIRDALNGEL